MTSKSYFHNGTSEGDAIEAPYSSLELSKVLDLTYHPYNHDIVKSGLVVTAGAGKTVNVSSGSAYGAGVYYNNSTTVNLTIDDNNTNNSRVDAIVVRVNREDQEARLTVVLGEPDPLPAFPDLYKDPETIYDILLAYIYTPASFTGTFNELIYDQRNMGFTPYNTMPNSEFLGFSDNTSNVGFELYTFDAIPDYWDRNIGYSYSPVYSIEDKWDFMDRGHVLKCEKAITPSTSVTYIRIDLMITLDTSAISHVLRIPVQVEQGWMIIAFSATKYIYPMKDILHLYFRDSTSSNTQTLALQTPTTEKVIYRVGQITHTFSANNAAPYGVKHETIMKNIPQSLFYIAGLTPVTIGADPYYYLFSAGSGSVELDLEGVTSVLMSLNMKDSGAAGVSNCKFAFTDPTGSIEYLTVDVGRLAGTSFRQNVGLVPVFEGSSPGKKKIYYTSTATGASSMAVKAEIIGMVV